MTENQQQTAAQRPEDSDYDRASLSMAQDDFYNVRQPVATQIPFTTEPVIHWGVLFVHENVVTNYGPGENAKAAAEQTVKNWADSDYPAQLVSQVILPWSKEENGRVPLVVDIRNAHSEPRAVILLREWLVANGYETKEDRKTGLAKQVPLVRGMRHAKTVFTALETLGEWMKEHGYKTSEEVLEELRQKLSAPVETLENRLDNL